MISSTLSLTEMISSPTGNVGCGATQIGVVYKSGRRFGLILDRKPGVCGRGISLTDTPSSTHPICK